MDKMHLNGIRAYGYLGALPEERILGQWFEVDLTLWLDLTASGKSDLLQDTLDYCDVIEIVQKLIKTSQCVLLERMATMIAEKVLNFDQIQEVQVRLIKPHAPISDYDGKITIEVVRNRNSLKTVPL